MPLQRITAHPVTDPDRLAALDEKRARHLEETSFGVLRLSAECAGVLDLCLAQYRRLPETDSLAFVARLLASLSEEQCRELMEWATAALSQDAFQQLKIQLEENPAAFQLCPVKRSTA
jgi:hypothetical protein